MKIEKKKEMNSNSSKPLVISALHLPSLYRGHSYSMPWLKDYVLSNVKVFVDGGIPAVMLQDEAMNETDAKPETIAVMAALGSAIRHEFPELKLGIIIESHDGIAPLAVAYACGASFVRIKVFVGAMLKSSGIQNGCGISAVNYRHQLKREEIEIFADVHDRTGIPMQDVSIEKVSRWAIHTGADGLILTGFSFDQSLEYLNRVRQSCIPKPLFMGGSVTIENVREVLNYADGVIVSSSLMKDNPDPDDLVKWDIEKVSRFMDVCLSIN